MSNKIGFIIIFYLIFHLIYFPAFAGFTLDTADFNLITDALDALPENAGEVTLKISSDNLKETDSNLTIPSDRGITGITIVPAEGSGTLSLPGIGRICANGVPLTIGAGLVLENASIYGGACASGEDIRLDSSSVTVLGTVGFVFGGGFAENGGSSEVAETSVTIAEGALVYYEVFGGGHAAGTDSRAASDLTKVELSGTTDYLLGAGFAEDGASSECTQTSVLVGESGDVEVALFAGGSAAGEGARSSVDNAFARLEGFAHWAFQGDFAFGGGETRLERAGRLEISASGSSVNAYLGSFASDRGSSAWINTAELMNCGTVDLVIKRSEGTDGGSAKTMIMADFPCSEQQNN